MAVSFKIVLFLTTQIQNCNKEINRVFLRLNIFFNEPWIYDIELLKFCLYISKKSFSPGKCFGITFTLSSTTFLIAYIIQFSSSWKLLYTLPYVFLVSIWKPLLFHVRSVQQFRVWLFFPRRGKLISFLLNDRKVSKHDVEVVMIIKYMQLFL